MNAAFPFLLGVLIMVCIFTGRYSADNGGDDLITKCELKLPRTQHCVLTAVPAQGEKP